MQNAQLQGSGERWARAKASRTPAVAAGTARSGGAVVGQRNGGGKPDASDSDEEQWQQVKAQVSAARALPAAGDAQLVSFDSSAPGKAVLSVCVKRSKHCLPCHPKRCNT